MRVNKWIGLGAVAALAGLLAAPGVQSAIKTRVLKSRVDPRASSDAALAGSARGETLADRRLPRGVNLPDSIKDRLANRDGTINVMVELEDAPAVVAFSEARERAALGAAAPAAPAESADHFGRD